MADEERPLPGARWLGLLGVLLVTAFVYRGAGELGFVTLDDPLYVAKNRTVLQGFTAEGLRYAFTTLDLANWHPLTWLSHMAVAEVAGGDPAAHHWTNVGLHLANAALFFLLLLRLTGRAGPAFAAAALFGVHPLHVESVAWVAERKDVLSTSFWLLSTLAYVRWVGRGAHRMPWAATALLAAGLLCKPMLVTLPFTLLLLDVWPLGRLPLDAWRPALGRLVREKLPLFVLVVSFSVLTFLVQRAEGAVGDTQSFPVGMRLGNAALACWAYLWKTVAPSRLAVFYPYPESLPALRVGLAAGLLVLVTIGAWAVRRRAPAAFVGWAWFLGTLVPVIGLVQVGNQAYADRYTYVPHLGLFAAATFLVSDVLRARVPNPGTRRLLGLGLFAVVLAPWTDLASAQVATWRDSATLWAHALEVTERNHVAHDFYGRELSAQGRYEEALRQFDAALALAPEEVNPWINKGNALQARGDLAAAEACYREALVLEPEYGTIYANLGALLAQSGRLEEAVAALDRARELDEADVQAHFNLMLTQLAMRDVPAAAASARRVLELDPAPLARHLRTLDLARILASDPRPENREGPLAVRLAELFSSAANHASFRALEVLAAAYAEVGRFPQAIQAARQAELLAQRQGNGSAAARLRDLVGALQQGRPIRSATSVSDR